MKAWLHSSRTGLRGGTTSKMAFELKEFRDSEDSSLTKISPVGIYPASEWPSDV